MIRNDLEDYVSMIKSLMAKGFHGIVTFEIKGDKIARFFYTAKPNADEIRRGLAQEWEDIMSLKGEHDIILDK